VVPRSAVLTAEPELPPEPLLLEPEEEEPPPEDEELPEEPDEPLKRLLEVRLPARTPVLTSELTLESLAVVFRATLPLEAELELLLLEEPPEDPPPPDEDPPELGALTDMLGELPPPRPRPLRLPRICGASMAAKRSAWITPDTRMVRCRSPTTTGAVRTATGPPPPRFSGRCMACRRYRPSPAATAAIRNAPSQTRTRRGRRWAGGTTAGPGAPGGGAGRPGGGSGNG